MNIHEFGKENNEKILLIHYWFAENEQKARRNDIKYMKDFFPETIFGRYPDLGHAGLVLRKPELFAKKIDSLA